MIRRQKLFTFESKVTAMVIAIILASTAFTAVLIAMISGTILLKNDEITKKREK